jgi:hypothetical protein
LLSGGRVSGACTIGVEGELELLAPVEGAAGAGHRVVPGAGARTEADDIGGMSGETGGDHALPNVLLIGQAQVFGGCYVAEEIGARHAGDRTPYGAGDVIVSRSNIGDDGSQHVEGRAVAEALLEQDIGRHLIEWEVAGPFHHGLHTGLPGAEHQFSQQRRLRELCSVRAVGETAGSQAVAQA